MSGTSGIGARSRAARRGIDGIVRELSENPRWRDRIVHWKRVPARPGRQRDLPESIDPRLAAVLRERGVERPWEHQVRAIELALARRDVLVATPTASGKTLCYTVPVLQSLLESDGRARALFLFPTKAL